MPSSSIREIDKDNLHIGASEQLSGYVSNLRPDCVHKMKKELYGLDELDTVKFLST